jgi:hypothetical protein
MTKEFWYKEEDSTMFMVLLRNLSERETMNMSQLNYNNTPILTKSSKKKKKSKADIIRDDNTKRLNDKCVSKDAELIKHYKNERDDIDKSFLSYMKTDGGRINLKEVFLKKAYKAKDMETMIELYLQLKGNSSNKYIEKIDKMVKKICLVEYQLNELSDRLPPLDFYNYPSIQLDDWQKQILTHIDNNESVVVCAPTSSGKTILSTYAGLSDKNVLYVVPTKSLAFQVASIFQKFSNKPFGVIVDDFVYYHGAKEEVSVIIATSHELETKLSKIDITFDYAVYDEIHNLDYIEGDSLERIIKLTKCNFLALSATIGNERFLQNWFQRATGHKVKLVNFSKRFINLQRKIWNDTNKKLEVVHPFACIDIESLHSGFIDNNLPFTSYDCLLVWRELHKSCDSGSIKYLEPKEYFKDTFRITLDDVAKYEKDLKQYITKLPNEIVSNMLDKFKHSSTTEELIDVTTMLIEAKKSNDLPCILFNTDSMVCEEILHTLVTNLDKYETEYYPYYYLTLEFRQNCYLKYKQKRDTLEKELKEEDIQIHLDKFDVRENNIFIRQYNEFYKRNRSKIENNVDLSDELKKIQLYRLDHEHQTYTHNMELRYVDIFEKHPEMILTNKEPMTADTIRKIRAKIGKGLHTKIKYTNILIQGLKRGIGLYTKDLPDVYLRIVQSLAQSRELGVVISDSSLALGINMPFRTVCLLGHQNSNTFSPLIYQQMIGRAGRRGQDTQGNIIFANVDWKKLMRGKVNDIQGSISYNAMMPTLTHLNSKITTEPICLHYMKPDILNKPQFDQTLIEKLGNYDFIRKQIIWKLRNYEERTVHFVNQIDILVMTYKLSNIQIPIQYIVDIAKIIMYIFKEDYDCTKINDRIVDYTLHQPILKECLENVRENRIRIHKQEHIQQLMELGTIAKDIHNTLIQEPEYYRNIIKILQKLFHKCKEILMKYHNFNDG